MQIASDGLMYIAGGGGVTPQILVLPPPYTSISVRVTVPFVGVVVYTVWGVATGP